MKLIISVDAEGISGVHKLSQVLPSSRDYPMMCKLMAQDVNAAIRGAAAAGADEIIVNDCHSHGDNIAITDLDSRATLLSGFHKPLWMAEGVDKDADALMLIGYHSRKGAAGIVSHTIYYNQVWEATVNGIPFGEGDFVAHAAGYFGVPTILLTGDDQVTAYAKKHMPGIHTVCVKEMVAAGAAYLYHPEKTKEIIEAAAKEAVGELGSIAPLKLEGPLRLEITFSTATHAALACNVPGVNFSEERDNKVVYTGVDYLQLYQTFINALNMAGTFNEMTE